jgi:hypothetical protein
MSTQCPGQRDAFSETHDIHAQSDTFDGTECADKTLNLPVCYLDAVAVAGLYFLWGAAFASTFTGAHQPSL